MFGLPFGLIVETLVAILLATTIGYCVVLNQRLKRLHSDRDQLRKMVTDLITATNLANAAVKELKTTAIEAEQVLQARLDEAERFGVELAQHVSAGQQVMDKIARITSAARAPAGTGTAAPGTSAPTPVVELHPEQNRLALALEQLASRPRIRGDAA
jgi:hypothetical protein